MLQLWDLAGFGINIADREAHGDLLSSV
jgi:hypothetical protein